MGGWRCLCDISHPGKMYISFPFHSTRNISFPLPFCDYVLALPMPIGSLISPTADTLSFISVAFTSLVSRTGTLYNGDLTICGTDKAKGRQRASNSDHLGPPFPRMSTGFSSSLMQSWRWVVLVRSARGLSSLPATTRDKDIAFCVQFALYSC